MPTDKVTDAEVVRVLAEYLNWGHDLYIQDGAKFKFEKHTRNDLGAEIVFVDQRYAIAACERICRERGKVMDCFFWGDSWCVQIGDDFLCAPDQHETEPTLARAAALAAYAVLSEK